MTVEGLFAGWVDVQRHRDHANITLLSERDGARERVIESVCDAVDDHLLGIAETALASLGFPRAAAIAAERLPRGKQIRSGDLAEILATEYVEHNTEFEVPLKRLRHKDDREMSMRGDDIIALRRGVGRPRVLKGEVKSRKSLSKAVVGEACASLDGSHGRPKAQTLGFIAHQLRLTGRDEEAIRIEDLMQANLGAGDVAHLVFTMSQNSPDARLAAHASPKAQVRDRRLVGLRVLTHQQFIAHVFERVSARYNQGVAESRQSQGAQEPTDPSPPITARAQVTLPPPEKD